MNAGANASRATRLYWAALFALITGAVLFAWLPPKHVATTICFYLAVALATACNLSMVKAGMVGKRSPYLFVAVSLTVIGFIPTLLLMRYSLAKNRKRAAISD